MSRYDSPRAAEPKRSTAMTWESLAIVSFIFEGREIVSIET